MSESLGALEAVLSTFTKILKANLTDVSFSVIKISESEVNEERGFQTTISDWLRYFSIKKQVHPDDLAEYNAKTSLNYLRGYFKRSKQPLAVRYRRRFDNGKFKWVIMEIVAAPEYTDENQIVFFYIKEINESYTAELEQQRELERICSMDSMTGICNFYSYKKLCVNYLQNLSNLSVGVIFADLNGLKNINDIYGHEAGNKYICNFADQLKLIAPERFCFRTGGDEFVVVYIEIPEEDFNEKVAILSEWNESQQIPVASIGSSWISNVLDITDVTQAAEEKMYEYKKHFYELHPEYRRDVIEENYSREMNAIIMDLARFYPTLGIIDLRNDTYRLIKFDKSIEYDFTDNSYSNYVNVFLTKLMTDRSAKDMLKIAGIHKLQQALENQTSLNANFQMKNGQWRQITFRVIETVGKIPVKVLFYASRIGNYLATELENERQKLTEYELLEGLSREYSMMAMVNPDARTIHAYKCQGLPQNLVDMINTKGYDESRSWFARTYVVPEDMLEFLDFTKTENIKMSLAKNELVRITVRTTPEFHQTENISISEFTYYRPISGSSIVVLTARHVT